MKIALLGYGKMGKAIETVAKERHEIVLRTDAPGTTADEIRGADVAIEFSTPDAAYDNILACFEAGVPVVCGTTGWTEKLEAIKAICREKEQAFLYASNFSIGVNILFELNRRLAEFMNARPQYEPRIEETHHTEKLDTPSGTAITLAETLLRQLDRKQGWIKGEAQQPEQLSVISYREPEVPGTHTVRYDSPMDTLELKHTASSREGFARGALLAAEWLVGKRGCYEMREVLGM